MNALKPWMTAYAQIVAGEQVHCPACGDAEVAIKFIGNPITRLGYARMWCPRLRRGVNLSRLRVPEGFEMIDMADAKSIDALPSYILVE